MQSKILFALLFSFISIMGYSQVDQHHRTYDSGALDTIYNHMESTTTTGEVITIGYRQFDNDKQTLVLAALDGKGNINWQREIDFGRDTTSLGGVAKIDVNETIDSIYFTTPLFIDGTLQELIGQCDIRGNDFSIKVISGGDEVKDIPNVASFIDSTMIVLKSGDRPTISRIESTSNLLWSRSYNFKNADDNNVQSSVIDIVTTADSTILLTDNSQSGFFLAAELDSNGVQLWAENYSFGGIIGANIRPRQIIRLEDRSTAIVGSYGPSGTDQDGFVMVVDTAGEPVVANQLLVQGNPVNAKNILQTMDGTLWVSGTYESGDSTLYFTSNMTVTGVVNWTTIYPGVRVPDDAVTPQFTSLRAVEAGGAFLAGHALDDDDKKILNVMKHNENGETPCSDTITLTLVSIPVNADTLTTEVENGGVFFTDVNFEVKASNLLIPPTLSVVVPGPFCPNELIDTVLVAMVGVEEITYEWKSEATGDAVISIDDTLRINDDGMYFVTVTIAEDVCYQMCDTVEVTRTDLPMPAIGVSDLTDCIDGQILFENQLSVTVEQGQAPFEYIWSTNETTDLINVTTPGTYSVIVTDNCGDVATVNIDVDIPMYSPTAIINQSELDCDNGTINLTSFYNGSAPNVGISVLWSTGETDQTITVSESGTYTVTITDECGLSASSDIEIEINPIATEATITFETMCDPEDSANNFILFTIESDLPNDINIDMEQIINNGQNIEITNPLDPLPIGNYFVQVSNGCGAVLDSLIANQAGVCTGDFNFPSVFFPSNRNERTENVFGPIPAVANQNNPMESDTIGILERISDIEFKIFNRWGEEVYSVDSEDNSAFLMPWDGTHKGDPAPSEVYIYYFSYRLNRNINPDAPTLIKKGDITLVR